MRSKTWAITLALLSRLMVGDCLGPPTLHRPSFPAADERVRDPDGEIDAAYRMREELARQNLLRHRLKSSSAVENGIAGTEVEYVDDEASPRHRYHSNRQPHARPHVATDEKLPPEMTRTDFRQQGSPPSRSSAALHSSSSRNPSTYNGGHHRTRGSPHGDREHEERGHGAGSQARFQPEEMEPERPGEEQLIRTDPYVRIRSGVDSVQPIAAAIAMQENLNSIEEEQEEEEAEKGEGGGGEVADGAGPRPRPPPEHVPTSGKTPVQPEPPVQSKIIHVDSAVKDNEVLKQYGGDGMEKEAVDGKEVQAALLQTKIREDGESTTLTEVYFLAVVAGCSVAGFMGLVLAGVCYYRLRKKAKATSDVEYPAYGVTGPIKERDSGAPGDRKLAQSAQMYHYQHQKQQMIASERLNSDVNNRGGSDAESEEENEEGDYTVFECPGLATNGDMEVRNPLFSEQTPVTAPSDVPGSQQGRK